MDVLLDRVHLARDARELRNPEFGAGHSSRRWKLSSHAPTRPGTRPRPTRGGDLRMVLLP
jgi:hypothetical protein